MARPKAFDRDEVLDGAIEVFWDRGYEAASVQDLVDRMGINRGSIYGTFGDKHGLFIAALERYEEIFHAKLVDMLNRPGAPRKAIEDVFDTVIRECACDTGRRGCLLTNTAVELSSHDRDTADRVQANFTKLEESFLKALRAARNRGEIGVKHEPRELARFFTSNLQGLRVMSKARPNKVILHDIVRVTLSVLD